MSKLHMIYATLVVLGMSAANFNGYALTAMFNGKQTANRDVNAYHK
ncbi:hypothetical protein RFM23_13800 [Mesorhizobium abyssinicae]|uniref:DUF680 domain-containing protein n=1 Tax=Mesorhizobium abyssinicae TaxID=1209958 RepID=A0ABU5AN07_9HYPH|nr:hypothetical protein [Mesorhizobium abyssinicae]MDX8538690.1 hypothetical protein [Mesorhizobium abyssinicae]